MWGGEGGGGGVTVMPSDSLWVISGADLEF